ncbi:MAG: hypothetical protein JJE46_01005 [Acidimicrobiia bacterium]|nr:hypothetical protein [Acidimicrobiia bacterium]
MNSSIIVSATIVVVIATIIVLISARREPDIERTRTVARYLDAVSILSIYVSLFATYAVVSQLSRFIVPASHRFGGYSGPGLLDSAQSSFSGGRLDSISRGNDTIWRGAVQAGLVLLAAGLIWSFHQRQRRGMVHAPGFMDSSGARVDAAFRYAVCFVAMFVVLMALSFGLYAVFRIAAPGVVSGSGSGGQREAGIGQALSLLVLGGGAMLIFRMHWSSGMRLSSPDAPATSGAATGIPFAD